MKILFCISIVFLMVIFTPLSFGEDVGNISLLLTYDSGTKVFPDNMVLKIYKNSETAPFKEISVQSNPIEITNLPLNNKYKIEAYANDLYQDVTYFELKEPKNDVELSIKSPGGLKFNLFYDDRETPIEKAKIFLKTMNGKLVGSDTTDFKGETGIFWIPQTIGQDYYYVEVEIDPAIKFRFDKVRVTNFEQVNIRIDTPWPKIVDSTITVEVYKDDRNLVQKSDGNNKIIVEDRNRKIVRESPLSIRGDSVITKFQVGTYMFHVVSEEGKVLASKKVPLTGGNLRVKIFLHDLQLNFDSLYCNCIAFRFDDVQDSFLNKAQIEMLKLSGETDLGLSIGVIGGSIGQDSLLVKSIIEQLRNNPRFELANHSLNNRVMTTMSVEDQRFNIEATDKKIQETFYTKPNLFIPPENVFDSKTVSVLRDLGYDHLSSSIHEDNTPKFEKSDFYRFNTAATTAMLDKVTGKWEHISKENLVQDIRFSLFDYGYAVVMMHPYEFSNFKNGVYVNEINQTKFSELRSLISELKLEGYEFIPVGKIDKFSTDKFDTLPNLVIDERDNKEIVEPKNNCNCVAFRIDNVQDFWINDVQNKLIETFTKTNSPVTLSVIGKFFGSDAKVVDLVKEKISTKNQISISIKGWENNDYSKLSKEEQSSGIRLANDQLKTIFGTESTIFSPPFGQFNEDTNSVLKEEHIGYLSGSAITNKPDFKAKPLRIHETSSISSLLENNSNQAGAEELLKMVKTQQSEFGYSLLSMQPSDFAKRDSEGVPINEINNERISQLELFINSLKENNVKIVSLTSILQEILFEKYPSWVNVVFQWNAEGLISDSELDLAIKYLSNKKLII